MSLDLLKTNYNTNITPRLRSSEQNEREGERGANRFGLFLSVQINKNVVKAD